MKKKVFNFCNKEMKNNPSLYVDSSNIIQFGLLAEEFINQKNISHKNENEIFDLINDWYEGYAKKDNFNI